MVFNVSLSFICSCLPKLRKRWEIMFLTLKNSERVVLGYLFINKVVFFVNNKMEQWYFEVKLNGEPNIRLLHKILFYNRSCWPMNLPLLVHSSLLSCICRNSTSSTKYKTSYILLRLGDLLNSNEILCVIRTC